MPPTATEIKPKRYRRPDTYQAAADHVGLSLTQTFEILNGTRSCADVEISRTLLAWARSQQSAGRGDSPAVQAALRNLS